MTLEEAVKVHLAGYTALLAETAAVVVIFYGTLEACWRSLRALVLRSQPAGWRKEVWGRLGMWLLLGLQFALAADIVQSAISPTWTELGQLAATAAIRTFLGYFLERDLVELTERSHQVAE